jgi:hypothetical protein
MDWLTDTKNSGALQAIGSIVQAMAAIFTFWAMVYLGFKQNKMAKEQTRLAEEQKEITRRQVNLSLFERRYSIYNNCAEVLDLLINITLPDTYEKFKKRPDNYTSEFIDKIKQVKYQSNENEYFLDDGLIGKIDEIYKLENSIIRLMPNFPTSEEKNYNIHKIELKDHQHKCQILFNELQELFKTYLDFKKI